MDIGTTSVKAVAADADGEILARARVPHDLVVDQPDHMEHRPDQAWRAGVLQALDEVAAGHEVIGVNVSAMVPSLCAVDAHGKALTPGLLYGDSRGGGGTGADPSQSGEILGFARWCSGEAPDAVGIWPAPAVANHALCGEAVIDGSTAMTMMPLFGPDGWDREVAGGVGIDPGQLPRIAVGDDPAGTVSPGRSGAGAVLGAGTIDALAEQLVAGADNDGDVLVILGSTLICWAVIPEWREAAGLWTIPHTAPGKCLIGGPSNAGGLFLDWVRRLTGAPETVGADGEVEPARVPVSIPYIRGERVPLHDPDRRAGIHDLDLTHGPAAVVRSAYEASGFVIRHHLDLAGLRPGRIVATGGGIRSSGWVQAIADTTGLSVDLVDVPEGAALGSAFLARVAAGLEQSANDASRWARTSRRVEPDETWATAASARYQRFRELAR